MHQSSLENMQKCYERYVKSRAWGEREKIDVLDVGGANVNGSYADIFSGEEFNYRAADINHNADVDIVLDDPYKFPLDDSSIDIVISGQVFEHVEFFWLLFGEMVRVLKKDGLIILIAPSAGAIHRYPVDCYRFYPDAYRALAKYCDCELLEVFHDQRGPWMDLVGVFTKHRVIDSGTKGELRSWQANRYETATWPVAVDVRHPDPDVEVVRGAENYLKVLERFHQLLKPDLYLEIGVRVGKSLSFAERKAIAVDPAPELAAELTVKHDVYVKTSDNFFECDAERVIGNRKIDLAFIDGMHLFEFALRDFINIEKYSKLSTVVVIDDISPNHKVQAQRQRQSQVWAGDVWKLAASLEKYRKDLQMTYLDTYPTGLLVITGLNPKNNVLTVRYNPIVREYKYKDLEGEELEQVVERRKSINPLDGAYLERLAKSVSEKKKNKNKFHDEDL